MSSAPPEAQAEPADARRWPPMREMVRRPTDAAARLRRRVPNWLRRLIAAGIVSDDPEVRRRQKFVNIATFAAAADALHHTVVNLAYDASGLFFLNVYNLVIAATFLLAHRFHRYGEHLAAATLVGIMSTTHFLVVWAVGLSADLHIYFTMAGAILFLFGIQNWRWWLPFLIVAMASLMVSLTVVSDTGPLMLFDDQIRRILSAQGFFNAMVTNALLIGYVLWALRRAEQSLKLEHARSEALLTNILPERIAERLKADPNTTIADKHDHVTVLFVDLVGFTPVARDLGPEEVVHYLDRLFTKFDSLIDRFGAEKIKTIGDAYMIVGGLDGDCRKGSADLGRLALALVETIADQPQLGEAQLTLRAGIHCGPAIAGVIGERRFTYDVWGDAVNVASRMESQGLPGRIQVSEVFVEATRDIFDFEPRGDIEIKGIGPMRTFLINGAREPAEDVPETLS